MNYDVVISTFYKIFYYETDHKFANKLHQKINQRNNFSLSFLSLNTRAENFNLYVKLCQKNIQSERPTMF